jgi:hypothetical protein
MFSNALNARDKVSYPYTNFHFCVAYFGAYFINRRQEDKKILAEQ